MDDSLNYIMQFASITEGLLDGFGPMPTRLNDICAQSLATLRFIVSTMPSDKVYAAEIGKATGTAFGDDSVGAIMGKYDLNGDGVFQISEVRQIVNDVMAQRSANKQLKKMICGLVALVVALVATTFATSLVAGIALKDTSVSGAVMTTLGGSAMQVDTVESNTRLFDLPGVGTTELAKMKDLVFYVDLTSLSGAGAWAEATFKVAGVFKTSSDTCTIKTTSGESVVIRRSAQSGELLMNGQSYPIAETCTGTCTLGARKLEEDVNPPTFTGPRRRLGFFSALQTSGSFTMMQAGGF